MIARELTPFVQRLLRVFPAVGLLGPRQAGKTTLARSLADHLGKPAVYLDLERPSDLKKLDDPEAYFIGHRNQMLILDEVHRAPDLFQVLRSEIDERRRLGQVAGQFLILGSATLALLQQSTESLAGRIGYAELTGFSLAEVANAASEHETLNRLWLRGGFPQSYLADQEGDSVLWRMNQIRSYLERDIPMLGPRIPTVALERLWTMLAHLQGTPLNSSQLGANLSVAPTTARTYVDLLADLFLVRLLQPWHANVGKRLVKAPKVYIRDSGLLHTLLNLHSMDDLMGHPVIGASWEGFVIENLLCVLPVGFKPYYYRTATGVELDLLLNGRANGNQHRVAIEIKRSLAPTLSKGFHIAVEDVQATDRWVVYPGQESYPISAGTEVLSLFEALQRLMALQTFV
jgi:uncharacterized protein